MLVHFCLPIEIDSHLVSLSLEIINYAIFFFYNTIENEARFVLECPLYDPIKDKFLSRYENAVVGSSKFFF